jgi:hypothetical protein
MMSLWVAAHADSETVSDLDSRCRPNTQSVLSKFFSSLFSYDFEINARFDAEFEGFGFSFIGFNDDILTGIQSSDAARK